MYFLDFQSRVRFVAFNDTPTVEAELETWLAVGRTWEELKENELLSNNIVKGVPVLGIFFEKNGTFITNNVGSPQISFENNPKSLLFAVGDYRVASSSGSISYDLLREGHIRREISSHFYEPNTSNLGEVWNELVRLNQDKASNLNLEGFKDDLEKNRAELSRLAKRNDPLTTVLPAISAEAGERRDAINSILQRLDSLSNPPSTINMSDYVTSSEFYDQLSRRATRGFVEGLLATKASDTDLLAHIHDPVHNPTYLTVGSPSTAQYNSLLARLLVAEELLEELLLQNPIRQLTTAGGILATPQGNGVWKIDTSYIGQSMHKPQETSFYFGGPLQQSLNNGGGWLAWEKVQIIGIRATLGKAPVGAPVVVDILKEGESVYIDPSRRPTFLDGQDEIIAELPDDVIVEQDEEITVDIINVGLTQSGEDLSIQMRYQYVE